MYAAGQGRKVAAATIEAFRGVVNLSSPLGRVAMAHIVAVGVATATLSFNGLHGNSAEAGLGIGIAAGFAILRILTIHKRIARSTVVLDAAGMVFFLVGTGAPFSPFYATALAGVWWAAHLPRLRGGLLYAVTFGIGYLALVVPQALANGLLAEAIEDAAVLVIVAGLSDWFVHVDKRALQLNAALTSSSLTSNPLEIRRELQRVLGILDIPVDVVLAAAQVGLTVIQAEILAYLVLGLTNREIAEATHVSEATVRYRLTRLYRVLEVSGRREAVRRAIALGLSLPDDPKP